MGLGRKAVLIFSGPCAGVILAPVILVGCSGSQSALSPAGPQAERLASLFWWMTLGTLIVWAGVIALAVYAVRTEPDPAKDPRRAKLLIVVGGAVIPTIVLGALLVYGLSLLPPMVAPAPEGSLRVTVVGEQWWWRVRYEHEGRSVELANEIRIPVDEPVQFELMSSNVIHAFWIPPLGGKRDMIPGRTTKLALTATRTGLFRGVCAEYCGASHALMSFVTEVMEKEAFTRWLEAQAQNSIEPPSDLARRGRGAFLQNGCGACHTIRGTTAAGVLGPDLTHVGGRYSLGAGILTNNAATLARWIAYPDRIKPSVHMPAFRMLPAAERDALAAFLNGLE